MESVGQGCGSDIPPCLCSYHLVGIGMTKTGCKYIVLGHQEGCSEAIGLELAFATPRQVVIGMHHQMAKLVSRGPDETPPIPEEEEADLSHRPMAAAGSP